jgi:hypothetical protein
MTARSLVILALCLFGTTVAEAAVSISEVAWMGDTTSANHEWIELINDGTSDVVVDGWTLSDGMNLNITLTGTIAGGVYAVLERTSEESALGSAFLLYTGAMVNTGATLILKDEAGNTVDQVTGGTDWQNIGGDNTTKETAQYTTKGWVTDVGTPGAVNGAGRIEPVPEDDEDTTVTTETKPAPSTVSTRSSRSGGATIAPLNTQALLKILPEVQSVAYVHQRIPMQASVSGLSKISQPLVRFEWNFGDTHSATGTEVWHTYEYPGTYAITTYARYGADEQMSRQEITVLPVDVSLTHGPQGEVQLHNDAPYDIDISGYILQGERDVVFPPRSILLTRSTITVAAKRLAATTYPRVSLFDTKKNLVAATYLADTSAAVTTVVEPTLEVATGLPATVVPAPTSAFSFTTPVAEASTDTVGGTDGEIIQILPESEEAGLPTPQEQWPYYALFLVLLLAAGALFGRKAATQAIASGDNN